MDLSEVQNTILDRRTKGIPGSSEPFPLKELKNKKWNILKEDMPMPLMVLKQKNYLHNLKTFISSWISFRSKQLELPLSQIL